VVYLETKIPKTDVKLEAVTKELAQQVTELKTQRWMEARMEFLKRRAKIEIKDAALSQEIERQAAGKKKPEPDMH
jgi:hypothetical protein